MAVRPNPLFGKGVNAFLSAQQNEVPDGPRPYNIRNSIPLTAAADKIDLKSKKDIDQLQDRLKNTNWQTDAYQYYRLIPELHRVVNMVAKVVSKANLYVGVVTDTAAIPSSINDVPDDVVDATLKSDALSVLRTLENGKGGISGMLSRMALSFQIAGECFLIEEPLSFPFEDGKSQLYVRSVSEIDFESGPQGSLLKIKSNPNAKDEDMKTVPQGNFMVRAWTPDPEFYIRADSPLNGALDACEQYLLLSKADRIEVRRNMNASILFIPSDLKTKAEEEYDDLVSITDPESGVEINVDPPAPLEQEMMESLTSPLEDESSASSVVPFILRGDRDDANSIRYIPINGGSADNKYSDRAEKALKSILNGMDIPPEIVNSMLNNMSQNVFSDDLYLQTIEPLILSICENLTQAVLRRQLMSHYNYTAEEVANLVIWYDPSAITSKPNRRESSDFGFTNNIISAEAWRKVNGYSAGDAPSDIETALRMVEAKGILNEEVTARALAANFPGLYNGMSTTAQGVDESGFNKAQSQAPDFLAEPKKSEAPSRDNNPEILFDKAEPTEDTNTNTEPPSGDSGEPQ